MCIILTDLIIVKIGVGGGGGGAVENMFETPTYNNSNRTDWLGLFTEYGFQ